MKGLFSNSVLYESSISSNEYSFCSKTFLMRILDKEVFINDIGIFRVELDTYPFLFKEDLFLDVSLMTCGLQKNKDEND